MKQDYDVIVIGAGANGLTTAALLAKRGRKVLVLERRECLGGLAAGEEFCPGYRTSGVLHDTNRVRHRVVEELALGRHGLEIRPQPPVLLPELNGRGLVLDRDPEKAAAELSPRSAVDAASYRDYRAFIARLGSTIRRLSDRRPPDLVDPGFGDVLGLGGAVLSLRLLGKRNMMEFLRITPMCVADWLNEWFEDELLKVGLAAPALEGCFAGPWSPSTTTNLLWMESTVKEPIAGGPSALITALEKAATANGVEIRRGTAVKALALENDAVAGVILGDGEHLAVTTVAASCDPRQLFLELLPSGALSATLERNISNIRARGTTAKVNLALNALPEFSCRPGLRPERILIGETLDDLERAFDPVKYRQFSRRPALDISVPTFETPELAPSGHHVLSILVHCVPYDLEGSWSEDSRDELYRVVVDRVSEYAPGVDGSIVGHQVLSPLDLETVYGVSGGHLFHGEHATDQLAIRPAPGCTGYRTPFAGLFLCGSGSHPGGGITCAPGALAARAILEG